MILVAYFIVCIGCKFVVDRLSRNASWKYLKNGFAYPCQMFGVNIVIPAISTLMNRNIMYLYIYKQEHHVSVH